ncbi:hypothetical protein [Nocardia fluminea]|uniref:hypothetical protein n=1 Tax=Nocardia fluminea TaxID=134984 RepID=UPI0036486ED9
MYSRGYRCDRCSIGWHDGPSCPYPSSGSSLAPSLLELQRRVYAVNAIGGPGDRSQPRRLTGPLPTVPYHPSRFRWWWIPVGLIVFLAAVILI